METRQIRILLTSGAVGGFFFILAFLVTGATRPDYNPFLHPVSSLSIGATGWTQIANFIITGLCFFACAIGLYFALRTSTRAFWGPFLIGLCGICLIGAGIFVTDPLAGYPPGTPLILVDRTLSGRLHDLFSLPVFLGLPIAAFIMSRTFFKRRERGWAIYSILSGIGIFAFFVLAGLGFRQTPGYVQFGGLFQRISISIGWIWIALIALHFIRASQSDVPRPPLA